MRGLEYAVVQRLAVRGGDGAELGHRVVRCIGGIRMVLVETILDQVGDQTAVGIAHAHLWGLARAGEGVDINVRAARHHHRVHAGLGRHANRLGRIAAVERGAVQLPLHGALFRSGEVDHPFFFVDALDGARSKSSTHHWPAVSGRTKCPS